MPGLADLPPIAGTAELDSIFFIMLDNVASPAVRQKRSKLAPTSCQASSMFAVGTTAVNVVGFFMALLSFRGFDTPSLPAQGEQGLPLIFNIQRGNASRGRAGGSPHDVRSKELTHDETF